MCILVLLVPLGEVICLPLVPFVPKGQPTCISTHGNYGVLLSKNKVPLKKWVRRKNIDSGGTKLTISLLPN